MVHAMNGAQFASKSKIYCLTDTVCINLLEPNVGVAEFAAKLFRSLLGYDSELWPKALGITMHLDDTHFCTLCLIATVQKLYVFNSLGTSDKSRSKIGCLAERLRIPLDNVEYHNMVMQTEQPYSLCLDFGLGVMNAIRQEILPKLVSFPFFCYVGWFINEQKILLIRAKMISVSCPQERPMCGGMQPYISSTMEQCLRRSSLTAA